MSSNRELVFEKRKTPRIPFYLLKKVEEDEDLLTKNERLRLGTLEKYKHLLLSESCKMDFERGVALKNKYSYRDYQIEVLRWCYKRKQGMLSLQMGLGKTLMGISIPLIHKKGEWPTLIVCPLNIIIEWTIGGINKFFGDTYKYIVLHNSWDKMQKKRCGEWTSKDLREVDYVITTYEGCNKSLKERDGGLWYAVFGDLAMNRDKIVAYKYPTNDYVDLSEKGFALIHSIPWSFLIIDESQNAANPTRKLFASLNAIYAENRFCLTGTHTRNKITDLWAQLRLMCVPGVAELRSDWTAQMRKWVKNSKELYIYDLNYTVSNITIPPMKRHVVKCGDMDVNQQTFYNLIIASISSIVAEMEARQRQGLKQTSTFVAILEKIGLVRQLMIDPRMVAEHKQVKQYLEDYKKQKQSLSVPTKASAKIRKTVEIIKSAKGKKVVMSGYVKSLNLLAKELKKEGISYVFLTGETNIKERVSNIERFRNYDEVLLSTYKVGGVGLNLQFATNFIAMEPWWNGAVMRQGYQRIWRPGQTKECNIYIMVHEGTMEQVIYNLCVQKREIEDFYKGDSDKVPTNPKMDYRTLKSMLEKPGKDEFFAW